jgi:hypothetical protein
MLNIVHFIEDIMKSLDTTFFGINEIFLESSERRRTLGSEITSMSINQRIISSEKDIQHYSQILKVPNWNTEEVNMSKQHIYIK